jgi:hypothetical protein
MVADKAAGKVLTPVKKIKRVVKNVKKKVEEAVPMMKAGGMMKSKAPVTFAPKSAKNVKGPSPKMRKGGKMC